MKVDLNVNATIHLLGEEQRQAIAEILAIARVLKFQGVKVMATLDDIQSNEEHEGTAVGQLADAVTALKDGMATLQQQLADALSGTTLPTAVQAKVDAAFAASKANSDKVDGILSSLAPPPPADGGGTTT